MKLCIELKEIGCHVMGQSNLTFVFFGKSVVWLIRKFNIVNSNMRMFTNSFSLFLRCGKLISV